MTDPAVHDAVRMLRNGVGVAVEPDSRGRLVVWPIQQRLGNAKRHWWNDADWAEARP